jgi:hypothetical protein
MATTLPRQQRTSLPSVKVILQTRPVLVLLTGMALLLAVQTISPLWYPGYDAVRYLSIARSAASGNLTNLGSPHLVYGIGYPLLLSPVFWCGPFPFLILSLVHAAFAVLYVAGTYFWARRHIPKAAVLIALLAVANSLVLVTFRRALSEAAFVAVMIWAVNVLSALSGRPSAGRLILAAALLSLLAVIRQVGILFVVGFAIHLAVRAWRRELSWTRALLLSAAVGVPATATLTALLAYDGAMAARQGDPSHLEVMTRSAVGRAEHAKWTLAEQCLEGLRLRISEVGRLTVPGMANAYSDSGSWLNVNFVVYLPLAGLLALGWRRFVRRLDVFALTLPFYFALYVCWPFDQSARFFVPLVPLLWVCFWYALPALGRRRIALLGVLLVLHTGTALGYWFVVDRPRAVAANRLWPDAIRLAEQMRTDRGPAAVGPGLDKTPFLMEYLLDRPVKNCETSQDIRADVRWFVTAAATPAVKGFSLRAVLGPYRLWHRRANGDSARQHP